VRTQGPKPAHVVNIDRLTNTFDGHRAQRVQLEIAFEQTASLFAHRDRAGPRQSLETRSKIGGMPDVGVLDLATGVDRAHYYFARINPHAEVEWRLALISEALGVFAQLLSHLQRGIETALGMVLVGGRRPE